MTLGLFENGLNEVGVGERPVLAIPSGPNDSGVAPDAPPLGASGATPC